MHRVEHGSAVDTAHDLNTLMERRSAVRQCRANAAGQARLHDLVLIVHSEERPVNAHAARQLRASTEFVIPAELRIEIDDAAVDANDVFRAWRREPAMHAGERRYP